VNGFEQKEGPAAVQPGLRDYWCVGFGDDEIGSRR
jgi:hypothetical protein